MLESFHNTRVTEMINMILFCIFLFLFCICCVFFCNCLSVCLLIPFYSSIFVVALAEALNIKVVSFLQEFHELISVALMINTVVVIICEKGKVATLESFLANCNVKKKSQG